MNVAVLIRGQLREWDNSKHSLMKNFNLFEKHHNVVYFFATWDSSYFSTLTDINRKDYIHEKTKIQEATTKSIKNDFKGKNLILKIVEQETVNEMIGNLKLLEEYQLISYIRNIAGLMKQNYEIENDIQFDVVIETRPDLFVLPNDESSHSPTGPLDPIPNFVLHAATEFLPLAVENIHLNPLAFNLNSLFVHDIIFISNGLTSDIITGEFSYLNHNKKRYFLKMVHPHNMLCDYFLNFKLINMGNMSKYFYKYEILRPLKYFDEPVNVLDMSDKTFDRVYKANKTFNIEKEKLVK